MNFMIKTHVREEILPDMALKQCPILVQKYQNEMNQSETHVPCWIYKISKAYLGQVGFVRKTRF